VKKTRRTEKTVEIHEFYAIRTASGSLPALCSDCPTPDAIMLPPDHAALLSHIPTRMIYRLVETGSIHYREVSSGSIIVCVGSLLAARSQVEGIDNNT
jgi:hypothetical protein